MLPVHDINRLLVRGTRWIGDAVMTVPALRALRSIFPHAHITLAAGRWAEGLFKDADFIDELLHVEAAANQSRARRIWTESRVYEAGNYDAIILFQNSFAAALTARLSGIAHRIGYNTDGRGWLLTDAIEVPAWRAQRHEVFYYLNIIAAIERRFTGRDFHATREPIADVHVSRARQQAARDILSRRFGVASNHLSPLVVLCPGSTNSRAKRWGVKHYAALADKLVDERQATVLLVGAGIERDVSDTVAALMRRTPVILTGETTLAETIALMSLAALVISNDTGPAHIAGALARPTLVIFGPTNPLTTRPFSQTAEIIREPPLCAPCMLRECPIDHRCMTRITPDAIFASASRLLLASENETSNRNVGVAS